MDTGDVPSLIRLFRARRGMSQREFAELAGVPDREHEGLFDDAGRHFPAHLPAGKIRDYFSPDGANWWGWQRIAWPGDRVPVYTYWRRPARRPAKLWLDAT